MECTLMSGDKFLKKLLDLIDTVSELIQGALDKIDTLKVDEAPKKAKKTPYKEKEQASDYDVMALQLLDAYINGYDQVSDKILTKLLEDHNELSKTLKSYTELVEEDYLTLCVGLDENHKEEEVSFINDDGKVVFEAAVNIKKSRDNELENSQKFVIIGGGSVGINASVIARVLTKHEGAIISINTPGGEISSQKDLMLMADNSMHKILRSIDIDTHLSAEFMEKSPKNSRDYDSRNLKQIGANNINKTRQSQLKGLNSFKARKKHK